MISEILIFIFNLIIFHPTLFGGFCFDDRPAVLRNPDITTHLFDCTIFQHDFWGMNITSDASHKSYRPLTTLTFKLNYLASGFSPFYFHLININIHGLNAILLHTYVKRINKQLAFPAAILFSSHPIHVEAVAAIVGRADLLCATFVLLGLLVHLKLKSGTRWVVTATLSFVAVMFKEHGIVLLPLILYHDLVIVHGIQHCKFDIFSLFAKTVPYATLMATIFAFRLWVLKFQDGGKLGLDVSQANLLCATFVFLGLLVHLKLKSGTKWVASATFAFMAAMFNEHGLILLPLALIHDLFIIRGIPKCKIDIWGTLAKTALCAMITAAILTFRLWIMGFQRPQFQEGDNPAAFVSDTALRWLNFNYIYSLNLWILLVPDWLCFDWSMGCIALIRDWDDPRIIAVLCQWLFIAALLSRQRKVTLLAVGWIVVPFVPSSNAFTTVGFVVAERNLYLTSIGVAILISHAFCQVLQKHRLTIALAVLVLNHGLYSFIRSRDWKSEDELFRSGLRVCPNNSKIHYNIAKLASDSGDIEVAERLYRTAIKLWPTYEHAINNLGNLLKGHPDGKEEARRLFLTALEINPKFAAAWMNLGVVEVNMGMYRSAIQRYKTAIGLRKKYADAHYNLGSLYLKLGMKMEALDEFSTAVDEDEGHFSAASNRVILLDEMERYEEAEEFAVAAGRLFPERPDFYFHLGNVYGKTLQFEKAEENFLKAIKTKDNVALYHLNLGVLYHRWKRYKEAAISYRNVLKIDPGNSKASGYLDLVIKKSH